MVYQVAAEVIGEEHQAETIQRMHPAQVEDQGIYMHRLEVELQLPEVLIHQRNHQIHCEALREMVGQVLMV
jgi:hypothetical protein